MSLIQDALKRQQLEGDHSDDPQAEKTSDVEQQEHSGNPPDVSGVEPDENNMISPSTEGRDAQSLEKSGAAIEKHSRRGVLRSVIGIVILLILAVGASAYLIFLVVSHLAMDTSTEMEMARPLEEPEQADLSDFEPTHVGVSRDHEQEEPIIRDDKDMRFNAHPDTDIAKAGPDVSKSDAKDVSLIETVKLTEQKSATSDVDSRDEVEQVEILLKLDWPRLHLTAVFVGLGKGQNSARINGHLISEGEQIEGVTLQAVHSEGVSLSFKHETRFLRMGSVVY